MQARQEKLLDLLGSGDAQFYIPVFQRSYTWTVAQCDELWRDMVRAAGEGRDHFAGTVLCLPERKGAAAGATEGEGAANGAQPATPGETTTAPGEVAERTSYQVVDGQQRLATLTLLMVALRDRLAERDESFLGLDAATVTSMYLGSPETPRLTMNESDAPTMRAYAFGEPEPAQPMPTLVDNLAFFREKFSEDEADLELIWRGLRTLTCIFVELDADDLPQDIFESFNSKGVQLTTADLCRNYLLAALPQAEQAHVYEEYWEPIEDLFGDDPGSLRLNNAILGWLTVRFRRIRAKGDKQAFHVFKRYMQEEFSSTLEELMGELYNFCNVWAENYRYHPVKNYKSATNWATLGPKTLVGHIPIKPASPEALEFYAKHFGVYVKR